MPEIIVIAHNIRSTHNVGALLRTCDGLGITKLVLSGYTPYPEVRGDKRLPHIRRKLTDQIHKTALGAELSVAYEYVSEPDLVTLRQMGYVVAGLEQASDSILLPAYRTPSKIALLLGEEVAGLSAALRAQCDVLLEIPMQGTKESFNVSVAAGMALYHLALVGVD